MTALISTLYPLLRRLMFFLDEEQAHTVGMETLAACEVALATIGHSVAPLGHPMLAQRLWDIEFPNPAAFLSALVPMNVIHKILRRKKEFILI